MKNDSRIILADYYGQPAQYYHVTYDHLAHKKTDQNTKVPVALLTNIYMVNSFDQRLPNSRQYTYLDENGQNIIADHCWVDFERIWFELPIELLKGDQLFFKADVNQYPISRADVINRRKHIWQRAKQLNNEIYSSWQGSKHMYSGAQYQNVYEQMRSRMQSNLDLARLQQQQIPLVDYSLKNIQELKVVKYFDKVEHRTKYNWSRFKKQGYKYSAWLAARSMTYAETGCFR